MFWCRKNRRGIRCWKCGVDQQDLEQIRGEHDHSAFIHLCHSQTPNKIKVFQNSINNHKAVFCL